jgi:hypothetical protein
MKIIEISRSFSRKIQLNQFEPIELFCSYKAEVDENDDLAKISHELYTKAMNDVFVEIAEKGWEIWTNPQKVVRQNVKEKLNTKPF